MNKVNQKEGVIVALNNFLLDLRENKRLGEFFEEKYGSINHFKNMVFKQEY
jgi:hypothetical protein